MILPACGQWQGWWPAVPINPGTGCQGNNLSAPGLRCCAPALRRKRRLAAGALAPTGDAGRKALTGVVQVCGQTCIGLSFGVPLLEFDHPGTHDPAGMGSQLFNTDLRPVAVANGVTQKRAEALPGQFWRHRRWAGAMPQGVHHGLALPVQKRRLSPFLCVRRGGTSPA